MTYRGDVIFPLQCRLMSCGLLLLWTVLLWTSTAAPVTRWKTRRKKDQKNPVEISLEKIGEKVDIFHS